MAKIFLSFNVITTDNVVVVTRELNNLAGEAAPRQYFAAPHDQRNITIDNLNPVMHRVEIWSTTDGGVTLGGKKGSCDIDASISTENALGVFEFIVDRGNGAPNYDPVSEQSSYDNPDLLDKEYTVFKGGYGPLLWGLHIRKKLLTGGFDYIDGQKFQPGEEYVVMVNNQIVQRQPAANRGYPVDVVNVTGNVIFGANHHNRLLEVNAAGGVITVDVTDFAAIPNGTCFGINTHKGTQRYVALKLPAGYFAMVNNVQRNVVYIGRGEDASFIKTGSYLRILQWDGDHRRLGETVSSNGAGPINSIPKRGGWLVKLDYPRIYQWYVSELPASEIFLAVDDSVPGASFRSFWGIGTLKFWVPDTGGLFERNIGAADPDGVRATGHKQAEMIGAHTHPVKPPGANSQNGAGKTTTGNDAEEGFGITSYPTGANVGTENRPANVATPKHIII